MTDTRPHTLYRFYDPTGDLLYVGITVNPAARFTDHQRHKTWWHQVATIRIEHHPTRQAVLDAERTAIQTERPRHNLVHNRPPRLVDDLALWGALPSDMPDVCQACRRHAGTWAVYYPFTWHRGRAGYECAEGHTWDCTWGHDHSGTAPALRGVPVEVAP